MSHALIAVTILSFLFAGGSRSCRTKPGTAAQGNKSPRSQTKDEEASDNLKVLAEGFHSAITNPFIAVIRDQQTYEQLAKLEPSLPKLDAGFFKSHIAIAAFLGEKNTGGYAVRVEQNERREFLISQIRPGKGQMVPQVITSPFKIVSVESSKAAPVAIQFDDPWAQTARDYTITKGTFTVSGGFAGRSEQFELNGGVGLMKQGPLVSFRFILRKKGESDMTILADFASGTMESDAIKIGVLSAGDLIPPPTNGLGASGNLTNHEQNLSLTFVSLPTMIADGFGGGGMIEAIRVVSTTSNALAR